MLCFLLPLPLQLDYLRVLSQTSSAVARALGNDFQTLGDRNWVLYRTHSFRRGGCQHRLRQNWTLGQVAKWGGWSQQEATTMYRYIYSPRDNYGNMEDFDRNDGKRAKHKYDDIFA